MISLNKETAVFALGGLDEVGKNTYCIEQNDSILIIDAGVIFPESDLPGIDYVIPDYTYLQKNQHKIKALIITHGHEDHIGGIPFLIQKISVPIIYAPRLAVALIKSKLEDFKIRVKPKIIEINGDSEFKVGSFDIMAFSMTHSIPDSVGFAIKTSNGTIVTTGDFKVDLTPIGNDVDFYKLARLGHDGVTLLLSDSTNAEIDGHTLSEKSVVNSINDVFANASGRLIVATFASNVYRIQQIVEAAVKFKRKIMIFGRSMEKIITIGRDFGYIHCNESFIVTPEMFKTLRNEEILILCTGSQGEPMAALSRIAAGQHKQLKIIPGDTVVFSSNPIPGNASSVNKVVNQLARAGANVLTNSVFNNLHTSGHAAKEELKLILKLLKPKYFMPVHGEYRMQRIHTEIAQSLGINKSNTFLLSNGDSLILSNGEIKVGPRVEVDSIYVEGSDITGQSTAIIRDRKIMASDGVVAVIVSMDSRNNLVYKYPMIISRGFVYIKERGDLITEAEKIIYNSLLDLMKKRISFADIKNNIKSTLSSFLFAKTHRNPMVIPVICNRKDEVIEEKSPESLTKINKKRVNK